MTAAVEVDVMVAGMLTMPRAYAFRPPGGLLTRVPALLRGSGEPLHCPLLAFVVRHPTAGAFLIDTGLHPDAARSVRGDYGPVLSLMFRTLKPAAETFERQLRARDVDPGDIELAVMTHLHVDHTSGMRLLPHAEFACARAEWQAANRRAAVFKGYASQHLPPASRMRLLDLDRDGEPFGPFARTIDLMGDGSVRLISTPGHTPGHLSVLLRVTGDHQVLVVGDAAYTVESIRDQVLPLLTADDRLSRRSLAELRAFADSEPEAVLIPTHDPAAWRRITTA